MARSKAAIAFFAALTASGFMPTLLAHSNAPCRTSTVMLRSTLRAIVRHAHLPPVAEDA